MKHGTLNHEFSIMGGSLRVEQLSVGLLADELTQKAIVCHVLDPFEIEDDWFEMELVGFQLRPSDTVENPFLGHHIRKLKT